MSFRSIFAKTPAEVKALSNLSEHDQTVRIPAIKAALQVMDMVEANRIMADWMDCTGDHYLGKWAAQKLEFQAIWTGSDFGAFPKCLK